MANFFGKPRLRLVKKTGKKHKNLLKESKLLPRVAARGLVLLPLRLLPPSDPDSSPPASSASSQGLHHPLVLLQVLGEDGPDVEEGEEDVDLLLLRQQLGGRLPRLELLCSHRQEPDEILEIIIIVGIMLLPTWPPSSVIRLFSGVGTRWRRLHALWLHLGIDISHCAINTKKLDIPLSSLIYLSDEMKPVCGNEKKYIKVKERANLIKVEENTLITHQLSQ